MMRCGLSLKRPFSRVGRPRLHLERRDNHRDGGRTVIVSRPAGRGEKSTHDVIVIIIRGYLGDSSFHLEGLRNLLDRSLFIHKQFPLARDIVPKGHKAI
jgi:hypothetical protein